MKKGLSKLILSGTAVAAVAATLGTSTYAWYTTNPTVSANNIVGASSDAGASSIYIAKDTTGAKAWSSQVTFADDAFEASALIPVQPTATGGAFTHLDGGAAADSEVVKFTLWFKSSKVADEATNANGVALYIKGITLENITAVTATNTTPKLPYADNLLYGETTYSASDYGVANTSPTYAVDFCRALAMQVVDVTTTDTVYAAGLRQSFALDAFETPISTVQETGTYVITNGKAHEYYNKVMPGATDTNGKKPGETGYIDTPALSSTDITAGKAKTTKYTKAAITTLDPTGTNATARKLDFYVYLNGWNDFCYDACQAQNFKLNIQFTKNADDALATIA